MQNSQLIMSVRAARVHDARGDAYARKILKRLKLPETYSKLIKVILRPFSNFEGRVRVRRDAQRVHYYIKF